MSVLTAGTTAAPWQAPTWGYAAEGISAPRTGELSHAGRRR